MEVKYHWAQMWLAGLHRILRRGLQWSFPLHLSQLECWRVGVMEHQRLEILALRLDQGETARFHHLQSEIYTMKYPGKIRSREKPLNYGLALQAGGPKDQAF